ncbi:MAG TPA: AMP-binding protein, partial [Telluria sp.]|nr:AMP-binding protein [Telluria sp.]
MAAQALTGIATLPELFERRVQATPHGEAYREFDPAAGRWMSYDWQRMHQKVREWSRALAGSGLKPGARVGILLPNGVATVCIDQAALRCGMVPVPMHAIDNPANSAYIIADSQVEILVLSDWDKWEGIAAAINMPIALKQVVLVGDHGGHCRTLRDIPALNLAAWLAAGERVPEPELERVGPDALSAIVYTSGTTGRPKGVMLSHANVLSNVESVLRLVDIFPEDLFLSFLPLSHTFERTIGYYLAIATGSCVAYVRSIAQIVDDLKEV